MYNTRSQNRHKCIQKNIGAKKQETFIKNDEITLSAGLKHIDGMGKRKEKNNSFFYFIYGA
jgi:hypothetical protein